MVGRSATVGVTSPVTPRLAQPCRHVGTFRRCPVGRGPFVLSVSAYQERVPLDIVRCRSVRTSVAFHVRVLRLLVQYGGVLIYAVTVVSSLRCRPLMVVRIGNVSRCLARNPLLARAHRLPIGLFALVLVVCCGLYAVGC